MTLTSQAQPVTASFSMSWRLSLLATFIVLNGCNRNDPSKLDPKDQIGGRHRVASENATSPQLPSWFRDATAASGIQFHHRTGGDQYFVPRSIGSGVALFDFNNDGLLDVYLIQNAGSDSNHPNQLYQQLEDHTFKNITKGSGLDICGFGMGAAAGDVNNDGRVDLVVTEFGATRLFVNRSTSERVMFDEVTNAANISNAAWGTSASLVDYDRDGWLDLVVANYLDYDPSRACTDAGGRPDFCGPQSFAPVPPRLFRNLGTNGPIPKFEDVTIPAGLAKKTGAGLGVLCDDFNQDDWPDIFFANDGVPNTLWINQKNGTFSEQAARFGVAYNALGEAEADMGIAFGDVNGDGHNDLFVTHRANETHTLWSQVRPNLFIDQTPRSKIANTPWRGTGFGTLFGDFDNDTDLDLALVNGRVLRSTKPDANSATDVSDFWAYYAQRDQLLQNDGSGTFSDRSAANPDFCQSARVSRGLACGDLNNDGQLDLIATHIDGPAKIFRNMHPANRNWLIVRAFDPKLKRDAYGTKLKLTCGEKTFQRSINPGYSYLASNDPRAHFGLADLESFDRMDVVWPDGTM